VIGKVLINSMVSLLASIGHCGSRNLTTESDVIKLLVMRVQACLNIPQAFPVSKLGIGKTEELFITGKFSDTMIALVLFNQFVKLIPWQMFQYLCENSFPCIHRHPSLPSLGGRYMPEMAM
jgi:hypothetical protein